MLRIWTKHFWDGLLFQLLVTLGLVGLSSHAPSLGVVLCSCSSASSPAPHLPHQHCLHHQSGKQALLIPQCASPVVFKLLSVMSLSLHFTTFSPWLRSGSILRSISLSLMSWSNTSGIPHWKTHNFCLPTQQPMTSAAVTKQTTGPPTASPLRIVSKLSLILCKLTFVCRISANQLTWINLPLAQWLISLPPALSVWALLADICSWVNKRAVLWSALSWVLLKRLLPHCQIYRFTNPEAHFS